MMDETIASNNGYYNSMHTDKNDVETWGSPQPDNGLKIPIYSCQQISPRGLQNLKKMFTYVLFPKLYNDIEL